jgi:hypothetical protein
MVITLRPRVKYDADDNRISHQIWTNFRIAIRRFNNVKVRRIMAALGTDARQTRHLVTHQTQNGASIGRRVIRRRRVTNILKRGY